MDPAEPRAEFTGIWEMNIERSTLGAPAPKRIVMRIEHQEPRLIQEILVTDAGGSEQRLTFRYETGAETLDAVGDSTAHTRARWGNAPGNVSICSPPGSTAWRVVDHSCCNRGSGGFGTASGSVALLAGGMYSAMYTGSRIHSMWSYQERSDLC